MEWIFDGIGSEIISLLLGGIIGAPIGYKLGIKNKILQTQKGGDNTKQVQIGSVIKNGNSESRR